MGRHEVTVSEFRDFVDQSRYKTDAERDRFSRIYNQRSGHLLRRDDVNWKMNYEGRKAGDDDPVVHVSWNDAQAYVNWLARSTGKPYRLPSEAEFEYALRGGKSTRYWWGRGAPRRVVENITGEGDISRIQRNWATSFKGYTDNFWGPAPVGSFEPSPYGLFDIGGNVGEWITDCWHDTYMRAPVDGSAWVNPGCKLRVIRGGYWASSPEQTRSAFRLSAKPNSHDARIGFRVARDL
jgi:formylglycine-generating enzyme required for sulfatase activity